MRKTPDLKTIGLRMREVRTQRGMTLKEVADRIGIDRTALNRYELGVGAKWGAPVQRILEIAQVLRVPVTVFFEAP